MSWSDWYYLETHHDTVNVVCSYLCLFIGIGLGYWMWEDDEE